MWFSWDCIQLHPMSSVPGDLPEEGALSPVGPRWRARGPKAPLSASSLFLCFTVKVRKQLGLLGAP